MSDCTASVDDSLTSTICFLVGQTEEKITENKFLLSKSSTVFEAMLCGELQEKSPISVPDIELDAFQTMLNFISGKEVIFSNMDHASRVCYAADKYDLPALKRDCAEYIFPCSIDDIWVALDCGVLYGISFLKDSAMEIVRQNTYIVLTSNQFLTLSRPALKVIVEDDYLDVDSEVEVFDAVMNWAKEQCSDTGKPYEHKNFRDELGDVIQHVRFLTMNQTDMINTGKLVLTTNELTVLLKHLNNDTDLQIVDSVCCDNKIGRKHAVMVPTSSVIHIANFRSGQEKQIVASNNIKCQPFYVTSNSPINLCSVTIPTRSLLCKNHNKMYFEQVVVDLIHSSGQIVASGSFTGRVKYDAEVRIPLLTSNKSIPKLTALNNSPYNGSSATTYNLRLSFKAREIYYYALRMCTFSSVFSNMPNSFSYVVGIEYFY